MGDPVTGYRTIQALMFFSLPEAKKTRKLQIWTSAGREEVKRPEDKDIENLEIDWTDGWRRWRRRWPGFKLGVWPFEMEHRFPSSYIN